MVDSLVPFAQPLAPPPGQVSVPKPTPVRWQDIVQRIKTARPDAPNDAIVSVVDQAAPQMTPQERASWEQARAQYVTKAPPPPPPGSEEAAYMASPEYAKAQTKALTPVPSDMAQPKPFEGLPGKVATGTGPPTQSVTAGPPEPDALSRILGAMGPVGRALDTTVRQMVKPLVGTVETAANMAGGIADIPRRAIEGAQQYQPGVTEPPVAPAVDTALMMVGGKPKPEPDAAGIGFARAPRTPAAAPVLPTDPEAAVLARVAPPKSGMKLPSVATIRRDTIDDLHLIKKIETGLNNGQKLDTIASPYDLMRLSRGSGGKAQHFNNIGTFDYNTLETTGPGLKQILAPVAKDPSRLKAYMLAKRAEELQARGVDTGINPEAARLTIERNKDALEPVFEGLQKYQTETLRYLKDAGILSDDAFKAMTEANQSYVPFYRMVEEQPSRAAGKGLRVKNPVYRIEGSERQIIDPLESVIKNTHLYIGLAERNRALRALRDMPGSDQFMTRVKAPVHATEVSREEIGRFLREHDLPEHLAEPMEIFRRGATRPGPDEIALWSDGKREVYRADPAIVDAVNGLDQAGFGLFTKLLSIPSKMLRAGVVTTPAYMMRNITRDQINAALQSRHGYVPVYDMMRGLKQAMTNGEEYSRWLKSGGSQAALVAMDRDYAGHDFLKLGRPDTLANKAKNVVTKPLELLREVSETLDNATRVGEFMRATKGSNDPATMMRGAMASRDVTQDFSRIGAKMRGINSVTAFMNAQIQGISRELGNLKERPLATLAKAAGLITAPSILLWAANRGDPRWEDAPNWEKDSYWFILPEDPNAEPIRVPKPFTFGMMFGSLPERILSDYFDNKPEAFNDFLSNLGGSTTPNFIPTFAVPPLEQWGDRSFFTNRDLTSPRLENKPATEHITPYTTEVAKRTGQAIGSIPGMEDSSFASPIIIDNYLRGWTGTLGTGAANLVNPLLRPSDAPKQPSPTWADIPVIGAFISRYPSMNAQPIQDVFAKADRAAKGLLPDADKTLTSARAKLWSTYKDIREVYADPDLSPEQKRDKLRILYTNALGEAKFALRKWRAQGVTEGRTKDDVSPTQAGTELYKYKSAAGKLYKRADERAVYWKELEDAGIKVDHRWSVETLRAKIAAAKAARSGTPYGGTQ